MGNTKKERSVRKEGYLSNEVELVVEQFRVRALIEGNGTVSAMQCELETL